MPKKTRATPDIRSSPPAAAPAAPGRRPTTAATPRSRPPQGTARHGPSHDDIAEAAYHRYLSRSGGDGSDVDDWVEAERELRSREKPRSQNSKAKSGT